MKAAMKITAFLLLGMVLVASAAEVDQQEARASISANQVNPGRYTGYGLIDPVMMMQHQRRLKTFWGWGGWGGFPGGGNFNANSGSQAQAGPSGAQAQGFANGGGFGGWGGNGFASTGAQAQWSPSGSQAQAFGNAGGNFGGWNGFGPLYWG